MNLYTFPQVASEDNGYSIVVKNDFKKLNINSVEDKILWYSSNMQNDFLEENHIIIERPSSISSKRFKNVFLAKPSSELFSSDLKDVKHYSFNTIFCGDTVLYRALRKTFPKAKILVRFHNCYYRIRERRKVLKIPVDLKYRQVLMAFHLLETEIFADENAIPVFLCLEDKQFYEVITGRTDSLLWGVEINEELRKNNNTNKTYSEIKHLVYFGGIDTHKKRSIEYFIKFVFSKVKKLFPGIQFHLYGSGTEIYQSENNKIFGHGYYSGNDFPHDVDGLYLNPDITGGGVKIKIKSYLENNLRIISTPFGYEGYSMKYIDNKYIWVVPIEDWTSVISKIIENSS